MTPANTHTGPGTKSVLQLRWEENLSSLAQFLADNERFPAQTATEAAERKLASWLQYQRGHALPDRIEALDRMVPIWRKASFDSRWETQLEGAASFAAAHGRHPRTGSSDRQEQLLGYWLVYQRQGATPERAARLDSRLPGWRGSRDHLWCEVLGKAAAFVAGHGHIPHQTGATASERSLAHWLKEQRRHATPERAAALDGAVPGWRGNHPGHRAWEDSFTAVRDFLAATGRLPVRGNNAERRMSAWLYDQSRRATEEQRAALDAALPGWEPVVASWDERHKAVLAFRAAHDRLPEPADAGDARALGVWLDNQRWIASGEARAILDSTLPGWHVSLEDKWNARLAELVSHIAEYGSLPRQRSDVAEKALSRWLEKQRRFAGPARAARLDAAAPGWRGKQKTV